MLGRVVGRANTAHPTAPCLGSGETSFLLITPVLILFTISAVYPLIETIRLSFFDIKGMNPAKYVGFGNYLDPVFRRHAFAEPS